MKIKIDYLKRFYSTNKTFQYHLHRNRQPAPPPPPPKKIKERKYPFILKLKKIVHIAQVSYFAHFAQVLYFAHFSRLMFSKGLLQNINKFQQTEKKINNERRKEKIDGCLNEEHVEYTTWILSARHPYFV